MTACGALHGERRDGERGDAHETRNRCAIDTDADADTDLYNFSLSRSGLPSLVSRLIPIFVSLITMGPTGFDSW